MIDENLAIVIGEANKVVDSIIISDSPSQYYVPTITPYKAFLDDEGSLYNYGIAMICANSIDVSFSADLERNTVNKAVDSSRFYKKKGDLQCSISFDYYLDDIRTHASLKYDYPFNFMCDDFSISNYSGQNFFPIIIGGNIYNNCYLESVGYRMTPFKPLLFSAKFKCRKPPNEESIKKIYVDQTSPLSLNNRLTAPQGQYVNRGDEWFVTASSCELSGFNENNINTESISEISYNRNYTFNDTSCVGDSESKSAIIKNIDHELRIKGTGIDNFIGEEGLRISGRIGVIFKSQKGHRVNTIGAEGPFDFRDIDESFFLEEGSYITNQNYNINKGIESQIIIKQPIK